MPGGSGPAIPRVGWQRRGVTTQELWPYHPDDEDGHIHGRLTLARINDARTRQASADFERIDAGDIPKMKQAIADHNVLYVSAKIHKGWFPPLLPDQSVIVPNDTCTHAPQPPYCDEPLNGYHAFLIVGYDKKGFWVHNSWGRYWGDDGYALLPYEEWKVHGGAVWVPRYTAPTPSSVKPTTSISSPV